MSDLSGKVVVVTGGGTGIGLGIAEALAAEGCKVVIGGRREEKIREAAESCDPPLYYHQVNVGQRPSVKDLFEWVEKELGPVDILVNSAGVNIKNRKMSEMSPEQWDEVISANVTGAYNCMYCVLPKMREKGDGIIINISSIAGKRAAALGGVAYCASKFAMTALGTAVGNEVASEGVRITNIYPGEVNTPILENRPAPVSEERKATMLMPEDLGHMVAAICKLPPRAHVPEMVIKPLVQEYI
jgi:NADP-dependent 3-hydroxy acid dehydrogenase YdfG